MRFILSIMLLFVLIPATFAQETLSEDEQALLDRARQAFQAVEGYNSYRITTDITDETDVKYTLPDETQIAITGSITAHIDSTVIDAREESPNISSTFNATVDAAENGVDRNYAIEGEARVVDGVQYANIQYANDTDGGFTVPEGWVRIEEYPYSVPWDDFKLQVALNPFAFENADDPVVELNRLMDAALSVTLTQEEINGAPVEVINVETDFATYRQRLDDAQASPADPTTQLFDMATITLSLLLDENEQFIGYRTVWAMDVQDLDMSSLSAEFSEGEAIVSMFLSLEKTSILSEINGTFEAVTAPEI